MSYLFLTLLANKMMKFALKQKRIQSELPRRHS